MQPTKSEPAANVTCLLKQQLWLKGWYKLAPFTLYQQTNSLEPLEWYTAQNPYCKVTDEKSSSQLWKPCWNTWHIKQQIFSVLC